MQYPDGRQPKIMTIEKIYQGLEKGEFSNPALPQVKGYNPYISLKDIKKTTGTYRPKALLFLADELNELMNSDDYKSVDTVKQALGSIARLGRAAGVHLALAAQRASGGTINSDLKNNIQMSCLLGGFDSGASTLMFEKDISNLAKPEIKGRGFLQSGNEIIETQTYYTEPENDWVFDETQKMTYDNPVYIEQKKRKHETIDDSGFVVPKKLDDLDEEEIEDNIQLNQDSPDSFNADDDWDDWDDEDDFEEVVDKPIEFKKEPPKEPTNELKDFINEFDNKEASKKDDLMDYINTFDQNNKIEATVIDIPIENNPVNTDLNSNFHFPIPNEPAPNPSGSEAEPVKKVIKFKL